jgi:hypothetical protein
MPNKKKAFISFDDPTVPVGKRKVLYVKWLMSKHGKTLNEAKLAAWKKFGNQPEYTGSTYGWED